MHSFAPFGIEVEKPRKNHPVDPKPKMTLHRFGIEPQKLRNIGGEWNLAKTTPGKDDQTKPVSTFAKSQFVSQFAKKKNLGRV